MNERNHIGRLRRLSELEGERVTITAEDAEALKFAVERLLTDYTPAAASIRLARTRAFADSLDKPEHQWLKAELMEHLR